MGKLADLTGCRFSRLTAIRRIGTSSCKKPLWECICECGKTILVTSGSLQSEGTKSCGCLRLEILANAQRTHGLSKQSPYPTWVGMIQRCRNEKHKDYPYYGGRGIKVCERWLYSFENFTADIGPRPSLKHSIDRIDVNGNYEPSNCRWATKKEQANNKRKCQKK